VFFFREMKVAQMMYSQTIVNTLSKEYREKQLAIARGPIDVPDPE
jgi:hypothetical protein